MQLEPPPTQEKTADTQGVFPQMWQTWFSKLFYLLQVIRKDGSYSPATLTDANAENNSIYYSSDASKLVYKDSGGTVNNLY